MDVRQEDQPCLGLFFLGEAGGVVADSLKFELQICRWPLLCCLFRQETLLYFVYLNPGVHCINGTGRG